MPSFSNGHVPSSLLCYPCSNHLICPPRRFRVCGPSCTLDMFPHRRAGSAIWQLFVETLRPSRSVERLLGSDKPCAMDHDARGRKYTSLNTCLRRRSGVKGRMRIICSSLFATSTGKKYMPLDKRASNVNPRRDLNTSLRSYGLRGGLYNE